MCQLHFALFWYCVSVCYKDYLFMWTWFICVILFLCNVLVCLRIIAERFHHSTNLCQLFSYFNSKIKIWIAEKVELVFRAWSTVQKSCTYTWGHLIRFNCIPGQSWGYLGFSTVTLPPLQRFLWNVITKKIFDLGLSNLVWEYIWGMALSLSFGDLGLQKIGQWRPLKRQNLGF